MTVDGARGLQTIEFESWWKREKKKKKKRHCRATSQIISSLAVKCGIFGRLGSLPSSLRSHRWMREQEVQESGRWSNLMKRVVLDEAELNSTTPRAPGCDKIRAQLPSPLPERDLKSSLLPILAAASLTPRIHSWHHRTPRLPASPARFSGQTTTVPYSLLSSAATPGRTPGACLY